MNNQTNPGNQDFFFNCKTQPVVIAAFKGWILGVTPPKVEIEPSNMTVTESLDSGEFTCKVTPTPTGAVTYKWTWKAPAGAGNNPDVIFSNPTGQKTKVKKSRWFAKPDSNWASSTGSNAQYYELSCEVTLSSGIAPIKSDTPGKLEVIVDWERAEQKNPNFDGMVEISDRIVNGQTEWFVSGIGDFKRLVPQPVVQMSNTSQFYNKVKAHEDYHHQQWTTIAPWKDLFNAQKLYDDVLKYMTSDVSETNLRVKVADAFINKESADRNEAEATCLEREKGAYAHERTVAPFYLEVKDSEVPPCEQP